MATKEVLKILRGAPFYNYIANLLAKAVSLPKHIIVASGNNALSHVIQARIDKQAMLDGRKLENRLQPNGVDSNNVIPLKRMKNLTSPQNQNPHKVVNTIHVPMGYQDSRTSRYRQWKKTFGESK